MVYRNSWLAGFAALLFAFVTLNGLLHNTAQGVPWQVIVLGGLALGIFITSAGLLYRLKTWAVVLINAGAALIAAARVAAPETTWSLLPTTASFVRLGEQLDEALELIRTGVEPVVPRAGIVVVIMLVLWTAGGLFAWGLLRSHPYVALLPPLVLSLQFATMDRSSTGAATIAIFVVLVAVVILAVTADERDRTTGRMAPRGQWPRPRRVTSAAVALVGITVFGSVVAVRTLDDTVPRSGVLDWRVDSGLPSDAFGSSFSVNPFVSVRQRLVNLSAAPAFYAVVGGDVPADDVYFRFMTMEYFDGANFSIRDAGLAFAESSPWERSGHRFAGPTEPLAAIVAIENLRMEWLPAPAVPFAVEGISEPFEPYLRVRREDGGILYDGFFTTPGMQYRVDALVPRPDVNVLATNQETGDLSIVFATAQSAEDVENEFSLVSTTVEVRAEPADAERFLELPEDPAVRVAEIEALARDQTEEWMTPYEKALALEAWLRTFEYTTDINPAAAADELGAWLLDETSDNYREGYCENFATALAVMARTIGIHSRVVLGFTPGEPTSQEGLVVVRDRNAHAWVELWMPSQGWVRFDPTPRPDRINPSTIAQLEQQLAIDVRSFLDIELPTVAPDSTPRPPELLPEGEQQPEIIVVNPRPGPTGGGLPVPGWVSDAAPVLGLLLLVFGGIPLVKLRRRRRRMSRLRNGDISAAWEDIVLRLQDLGDPVDGGRTPAEVAANVDDAMAPLATVYGKSIYGPSRKRGDSFDVATAERSLQKTREHLVATKTKRQRLAAWYRPSTGFLNRGRLRRRRES